MGPIILTFVLVIYILIRMDSCKVVNDMLANMCSCILTRWTITTFSTFFFFLKRFPSIFRKRRCLVKEIANTIMLLSWVHFIKHLLHIISFLYFKLDILIINSNGSSTHFFFTLPGWLKKLINLNKSVHHHRAVIS